MECIFHFPSRLAFLKQAARVLRPRGILSLSDFVPLFPGPSVVPARWVEGYISKGYGTLGTGFADGDYRAMAAEAGLEPLLEDDITAETVPTYPFLLDLIKAGDFGGRKMLGPTRALYWLSRLGLLRYKVLSFRKP